MQFDLVSANSTVLSYFFFFFLIIGLYFLIAEAITQILNHIAELLIPPGVPIKEEKPVVEIHSVICII